MSGAVSRRGLCRGLQSRRFMPADLVAAADQAHGATRSVFVDVDSEGYLCTRGGGGGASGAAGAAVTVRARLADHAAACDAVLTAVPAVTADVTASVTDGVTGALQLRLVSAVPPLHDLRVWLHDDLIAQLPHLTPRNIQGDGEYRCEACGARFSDPYPLQAHLFLRCEPLSAAAFWRRLALGLQPAGSASWRRLALGLQPAGSAFRRVSPPPWHPGARLEALAAAWGPGSGGRHACLYCGKLYSRKYGLKIHIRTHTGYRPLRCRHCARAFGDPSNLNKHVRLHAAAHTPAVGGHKCPRCGKPLARRRDLERHRAHCAAP